MSRDGTKRPAPADLMETWASLGGIYPLSRHYRAGKDIVRRWLHEAGVDTAARRSYHETPADLAATIASIGASGTRIAEHYGVNRKTARRWMRECGIAYRQPGKLRPCPDDLREMREKLGSTANLQKHYRASSHTLTRWLQEIGATRLPATGPNGQPHNKKPVPDDFATLAPTMTKAELQRHYGAIQDTVNRWIVETGITARRYIPAPFVLPRPAPRAQLVQTRNYGPEDLAADTLRKWGPVFRCTEKGRADHTGTFWRFGNTVLTGDELVARAARKAA